MKPRVPLQDLLQHPVVRAHVYVCLGALVVMFIVLVQRGFGMATLLPVLVGALGVARRWRSAPLVLLAALTAFISARTVLQGPWARFERIPQFRLEDWILCGAFLAYAMTHYRLQGLVLDIFPPDPRRREGPDPRPILFWRRRAPIIHQTRSPDLVSTAEMTWLLLSLPLWATLAQVWWVRLPASAGRLDLSPREWRALFLVWLIGLSFLITAAVLSYVSQCLMSWSEASLILQDTLWAETRGEQRRIQRWLVWSRLRRRRRKGH